MKRRPPADAPAAFRASDVYRLRLLGLDRYRDEVGEPPPELLAAAEQAEARVRRAGQGWISPAAPTSQ